MEINTNYSVSQIYRFLCDKLKNSGIIEYKFESDCIFEDVLNISKHDRIISPDRVIQQEEYNSLIKVIDKRISGYPLQYIIGKWEFYGNSFFVGEGVLIPRSDTEILVDVILSLANSGKNASNLNIIDLCSGSGCIGITLAKNLQQSSVKLIDISSTAIEYINKNITHNKVKNAEVYRMDVLDQKSANKFQNIDILVSNPPYIPTNDISDLQKEVQHEPKLALDGGEDGLIFYREITEIWKRCLKDNAVLAFEIGYNQAKDVSQIMQDNNFVDIKIMQDINQNDRVVFGYLKKNI